MTTKLRTLLSLAALCSGLGLAGAAQALNIAGWGFEQLEAPGSLSTDGVGTASTLAATTSDMVPGGAGSGAASFGTLYFDGSAGSTSAPAGMLPAGFSLEGGSREGAAFDSLNRLRHDGFAFANRLSLTTDAAVSLVFEAEAPGYPSGSYPGFVRFGGRVYPGQGDGGTLSGAVPKGQGGQQSCDPAGAGECTSTVSVEVAPLGATSYTNVGTVTLTARDQTFDVALGTLSDAGARVRLVLDPATGSGGQPVIDNVLVTLPEPGRLALLVSGIAMLVGLARRRR